MIVGLCLSIMLILTLVSIIMGNSWVSNIIDTSVSGTTITNGSSSTFNITNTSSTFNIDPVVGAISIITVIIILVTLIGIRIVASGLSDQSIRVITFGTAYGGLWALLSFLAYPMINSIETFGALIYVSLTIIYVVGVVQKGLGSGGSEI